MAATRATLRQVAGAVEIRTGSVSVGLLDTTVAAAFLTDMGGTDYAVTLRPDGFAATLSVSGKAVDGFDIDFTAGIEGTIEWTATRPL